MSHASHTAARTHAPEEWPCGKEVWQSATEEKGDVAGGVDRCTGAVRGDGYWILSGRCLLLAQPCAHIFTGAYPQNNRRAATELAGRGFVSYDGTALL